MKTGYEGDLNPRVNSNWLLYMIISFKSRYLPKSEHLQLIQLYNCFCTSSCIKASLSSFLCWARKSSSRLNAPCQRLLFSHISPHTPNVTSFCREKKKSPPTPVDELYLCRAIITRVFIQVRHGSKIVVPSHGWWWMRKAFHKNSKEACGQVRAIIDKLKNSPPCGQDSHKMAPTAAERAVCAVWLNGAKFLANTGRPPEIYAVSLIEEQNVQSVSFPLQVHTHIQTLSFTFEFCL